MKALDRYYYPIILLFFYSITTVFFFLFGPYEYKITGKFYFFAFLSFVNFCILAGYWVGQRSYGRESKLKFSSVKATKYCILITFIYKIINLALTGGGDLFRLSLALDDPTEAYNLGSTKGSLSVFNYVEMFLAPIVTIAITAGIFFWSKLNNFYRIQVILYIIIVVLCSIGASVRSSIIAILINIFSGLILSHVSKNFEFTYKLKILAGVFFASFIVLFFLYTNNLAKNRGVTILVNPLTLERPNENSLFYKVLPEEYVVAVSGISFYLGHSYYRLNQAMSLPFKGLGFGFSNSFFLMDNIERLTGWDGLKKISYGYRLDESQIGKFGIFWSTTYTWWASDFTFPGVVLVVFMLSYWLAISMKDTMRAPTIFSIGAFTNLFGMIYSLPAVNPLQDGSGLINFSVIFLMWILFRQNRIDV